jgi:dolichol-phosphate mannosyltransferase
VLSYPKPLTISQHTLQAVGAAPLSIRENLFLRLQSRLHSKGGRKVGMWLSEAKTPAASLNALVQLLIPPPKFMVDRLVPGTRYGDKAQLEQIVLIERGPDFQASLDDGKKADILLANADDAYGFPPYPSLASRLRSYQGQDLQAQERRIVEAASKRVPGILLRSSSFDWYKRLPGLLTEQPLNRRDQPDEMLPVGAAR